MAAGKYAKIINQLPRTLGTDPGFQDKVNAMKEEILRESLPEDPPTVEPESVEIEMRIQRVKSDLAELNNLLLRSANGRRQAYVLARVYRRLRYVKDILEKQSEKELNVMLEAYTQLIVDQYEVEGTSSIHLDTGESVSVHYEPYASVHDRDKLRQWVIDSGLERSMSLAWATLNSMTKERLLKGESEPDGVKAYAMPKIVLRR